MWFAAGILLARYTPHAPIQLVVTILILSAGAVIVMESRLAWIPVAALWVALGVCAAEWQPMPANQAALLANADNLSRTVRARITRIHTSPPVRETIDVDAQPPWEAAEDTSQQRGQPLIIDLATEQVEAVTPDLSTMVPVMGGIRVSVFASPRAIQAQDHFAPFCGEEISVPLRLKVPDRFRTPGAFDYAGLLLGQGIAVRSNVSEDLINPIGAAAPGLRCRLYAAQAWASVRLIRLAQAPASRRLPTFLRLSQADAQMINAMLFGDRSGLTHSLRTGFERTGTFHLFVVSGLHIGLMAAGLYWLIARLRAPVWLATFATILGTAAYAALTGFGQPAQRALTMSAVFLVARLLSRDRDSLNALGAAVLAMLVLSPASLFDASFQMTALVILSIAGIAVPLSRRTPVRYASLIDLVFEQPRTTRNPPAAQLLLMLELWGEMVARILPRRWKKHTRKLPAITTKGMLIGLELALVSLIVELIMVLPMTVYFHRLPIFSVPANMLILPLIGFLVPAAIVTFALSMVSVPLATAPAAFTALLLHSITFAIHRLSGLRAADTRIPPPVWWIAALAILGWFSCCWLARRSRSGALAVALALPAIAACILWPEPAVMTPGSLEITALDVGQGDSILAINPEGGSMLVDAGGPVGAHGAAESLSAFDIGEQVVAPYLWSRRIRRLDVLVLSHAHTDHMGGMPAILEAMHPRELWVGIDPPSPLYDALLARAANLAIPVRHLHAGDHQRWGTVEVTTLSPARDYQNRVAPKNDDSLVFRFQLGKASVLLEGDAERPSEDTMLAAGLLHPVTLLKVGHHGSRSSSTPEFLAAVEPQQAVISVGRNNTFGHPRTEVIERFAASHTRLFRTDLFGLSSFLLTPDGRIRAAEISP